MPFLVRIGRIGENVSGVGSRGYAVIRQGRVVSVYFGKIEAVGRGTTRFRWCTEPTKKPYRRSSERAARALARQMVNEKVRPDSDTGYHRLPPNVRIHAPAKRRRSSQ